MPLDEEEAGTCTDVPLEGWKERGLEAEGHLAIER